MRSPDLYRLTFLLPDVLRLSAPPGRHRPCLHGCQLNVDDPLVEVLGPNRNAVFEQTRRFLKIIAKGHGALSIAMVLESPERGRDTWTAIVGAEVAFSATSLPPDLETSLQPQPENEPILTKA